MTTVKSYTDVKQSRRLMGILPIDSADGYWFKGFPPQPYMVYTKGTPNPGEHTPCWSLAALIDVLPIDYIGHKHYFLEISKMGDNAKPYEVRYFRFKEDWEGANFGRITHISCASDNLIDACYDMIITLHNRKLL